MPGKFIRILLPLLALAVGNRRRCLRDGRDAGVGSRGAGDARRAGCDQRPSHRDCANRHANRPTHCKHRCRRLRHPFRRHPPPCRQRRHRCRPPSRQLLQLSEAAAAAGNPDNGKVIFNTPHDTANGTWACAQCHSVSADKARIIGPGLWDLVADAGSYVPGEDAQAYIRESIVNPNAFIAPGDPPYPPNLMPQNWGDVLTPQELNDVIAY